MEQLTLPVVYAGNIFYYKTLLKNNGQVILDVQEHFVKQSYRNRAEIHGANGKLSLIIPLEKRNQRTPMKDVKIAYEQDWQKHHWKSLQSAYRSSPYFEFYEHYFKPFYTKDNRYTYLLDFNIDIMHAVFKVLNIEVEYTKSLEYKEVVGVDYRKLISPKIKNDVMLSTPYNQVFEDRNGFIPNLSVFDLIFNEGPNAINHIL